MLTACILTCNELEPLKKCLASIKGHVDDYVIGIDDKTNDGTEKWLREAGYNPFTFKFTDFGSMRNGLIDRVKSQWLLTIDSDEIMLPAHAARLRDLCHQGNAQGVDTWTMSRLHWFDLEMTREWVPCPNGDSQYRLMRKHVRYSGRVHEQCVNFKKSQHCDLQIQHFNIHYRDATAWAKTNKLYQDLAEGKL
jgi:glycosyltransferase involved in cell wall biosynthesis